MAIAEMTLQIACPHLSLSGLSGLEAVSPCLADLWRIITSPPTHPSLPSSLPPLVRAKTSHKKKQSSLETHSFPESESYDDDFSEVFRGRRRGRGGGRSYECRDAFSTSGMERKGKKKKCASPPPRLPRLLSPVTSF